MLGEVSPEPSTDEETYSDQEGDSSVDVAGLAVLPECEKADGGEECAERGSLSAMLIHAEDSDESGNDEEATADADDSGDDTYCEAKDEDEGGLHLSVSPFGEEGSTGGWVKVATTVHGVSGKAF
jgi:hypothetical protein